MSKWRVPISPRARSLRRLLVATSLISSLAFAGGVQANHFTTLTTPLTGDEEVPGPGDPNGKGFVALDIFTTGTICWSGKVQAIAGVSAAHIHRGAVGMAGPVVVDLRPDQAAVTGNKAEYCVSTTPELAAEIVATPTAFYLNVHNADYPAGAIRGQLGD